MSRRREALELRAALELSTQQNEVLIVDSSFDISALASEQVINSKDLELVEGSTIVMELEKQLEEDIVADSEDEQEIDVLRGSKPSSGTKADASNALSSIKSFTPSNIPTKTVTETIALLSSSGTPRSDLIPHVTTSSVDPSISPTVVQTRPSPRSSPAVWPHVDLTNPHSLPLKPKTYSKLGSRKSVTPARAIDNKASQQPTSAAPKTQARTKSRAIIDSSDSQSEADDAVALKPYHNEPESSSAASKRSKKRKSVADADSEDEDEVVVTSAPASKKRPKKATTPLPPSSPAAPVTRSLYHPSSPDPLELRSGPSVPASSIRAGSSSVSKKSAKSAKRGVVLSDGEDDMTNQLASPAHQEMEQDQVEIIAPEPGPAPVPSTAKGKKGKAAAKAEKPKATPKAKAAPKGKGKGKGKATQSAEMIEDEEEVLQLSEAPAPVEPEPEPVSEIVPEIPDPIAAPRIPTPEPPRRPLDTIRTDANVLSTPTRDRITLGSPGPSKLLSDSKLGGIRTPQGLPLVNAMFGGARRSGMSRTSRLPSLHTKIKTPPKALPPVPIKPVRKKKGEESDEDEDEEFDADGNVIKKPPKVKGMEWYMMED